MRRAATTASFSSSSVIQISPVAVSHEGKWVRPPRTGLMRTGLGNAALSLRGQKDGAEPRNQAVSINTINMRSVRRRVTGPGVDNRSRPRYIHYSMKIELCHIAMHGQDSENAYLYLIVTKSQK
jgi:hypothetical protein